MWTRTVTQLQVQLNIMHLFDLFHEMNTKDARDADKSGQIIMGNSVHFQLRFLSISLCLLCHVGYYITEATASDDASASLARLMCAKREKTYGTGNARRLW